MDIIGTLVLSIIGIFFIIFGIHQTKSTKPVSWGTTFDAPAREENISNLKLWNLNHGMMWIIYGSLFVISSITLLHIQNILVAFLLLLGVSIIPLPIMLWYHIFLTRKYYKSNLNNQ